MSRAVFIALLVLATSTICVSAMVSHTTRSRLSRYTQTPAKQSPFQTYLETGLVTAEDNPFSQLNSFSSSLEDKNSVTDPSAVSFLEVAAQTQVQVQKVRSYCEICILVMQMKQRGEAHLCAGLNANYYITCIEILESLLRADKAVVYWLKNGCMHMDSTGPEIVRPCPALSVCSWVPNLFAQPPSLVRDGVESLCPKDPKFLPTIPNEYKALLSPAQPTQPAPGF